MSESGLGIHDANPYYWTYDGEPTLLLGGSSEDNLFQVPGVEHELDALAAVGGNYVRCTMSSRDEGNVPPFARGSEGYDLDAWNEEYWERFERFLAATAERDVVVQIELWATFDYYRDNWARNPFNPANNSTYSAAESGLPTSVDSHPVETDNDFFRSPPAAMDLPVVREYQERFVDRLLEHALEYDHVLYCMDNETSVTPEWGAYWSRFVRARADEAGETVYTTEMWDPWDLSHEMHDETFDHPEIYDFVDVSQNNHNSGREHYDNALAQRERIAGAPRPMNNVKIYGGYGDYGSPRDGVERFFRNIFAGTASARFHRPASGIGLDSRARRMLRSAREIVEAIDVPACEPAPARLDDREVNEAYLLSNPGTEYAAYFPDGGAVDADLEAGRCRWYDVEACRWGPEEEFDGRLDAPGDGHWVAVLD